MPHSRLIQRVLTYRRRRASRTDWGRRHRKVLDLHPALGVPRSHEAEQAHLSLWRPLRKDISLDTYRICANLSGIDDPHYIPEELFVSELQAFLYPNPNVRFLADKNAYDQWFGSGARESSTVDREPCPKAEKTAFAETLRGDRTVGGPKTQSTKAATTDRIFPRTYLRKIGGVLFDEDYCRLDGVATKGVADRLPYPVVCKPSRGSFGGQSIFFCQDPDEVGEALRTGTELVVQERIEPHEFFAQFSRVGLNTLRVYCYREAKTESWHVLNTALRMGVGGSLDNETAGGIACFVDGDGFLNSYALDKYAGAYEEHPDNGLTFAGMRIPEVAGLHSLSLGLAEQVWGARLVGLDMCLDARANWRCIEVNLGMQTIRFAQYAGHPFFGDFTQEVINTTLSAR